jgi:hypothetical protein
LLVISALVAELPGQPEHDVGHEGDDGERHEERADEGQQVADDVAQRRPVMLCMTKIRSRRAA